jgi:hypothetical protein
MPGDRAAGLCSGKTAMIASQSDGLEHTVLHETGHILDNLNGPRHISRTPEWENLWQQEQRAGHVPEFACQHVWPSEYFAESFAAFWTGNGATLSAAVRAFIEGVSHR